MRPKHCPRHLTTRCNTDTLQWDNKDDLKRICRHENLAPLKGNVKLKKKTRTEINNLNVGNF
jgi:hypothetical protein